jgi:hypothetical protein
MKLLRAAAPRFLTVTALLLLLVASGCGDAWSPGKFIQLKNEDGVFQFQVSDIKNYSHTYSYTWVNSVTTGAIVNQLCTISGGDATLVLKDASGTTVYSKSLKQNGRFTSAAGPAGHWTVQILANNLSGSLLVRVERNL